MLNERLLPWFAANTAEALFLKKQPNVRWSTGFRGADTCTLITPNGGFLITDPRYTEQAGVECPDFTVIDWRTYGGSVMKTVARIVKEQNIHSVAFESDTVSFGEYSELRAETEAELIPTVNVVENLRSIKTKEEIGYMRAACDISCRAFNRLLKDIRVGVTEKELAAKLSAYMVMEGADTHPYGIILLSGPNTSMLHGISGNRAIQYGDFVLVDFGCQVEGYMSDMTRTVVVGKATDMQKEVYALEKQMLEDSLAVMKAGTKTGDVYTASLRAIQDTPYFNYHYNGLGHGIGLFVHEVPFIRPGLGDVYQPDIVTTIEPGLYIPGWGGVRIEDQVIITENGNENLISVTHDLIEL
ncbi:MAG: M24 family metallopeptidase [Oscillospiraceae bacterium]